MRILMDRGFKLVMTAETDDPNVVATACAEVTDELLLAGDRAKANVIDQLINQLSWMNESNNKN